MRDILKYLFYIWCSFDQFEIPPLETTTALRFGISATLRSLNERFLANGTLQSKLYAGPEADCSQLDYQATD